MAPSDRAPRAPAAQHLPGNDVPHLYLRMGGAAGVGRCAPSAAARRLARPIDRAHPPAAPQCPASVPSSSPPSRPSRWQRWPRCGKGQAAACGRLGFSAARAHLPRHPLQAAAPPAPPGTVRQWSKWATDEAGNKAEWGAFVAADGTETPWGAQPAGSGESDKKAVKKGAAGESDAGQRGKPAPRTAAAGESVSEAGAAEAGEAVPPRGAAGEASSEAGGEAGVSIKSAKHNKPAPPRRLR